MRNAGWHPGTCVLALVLVTSVLGACVAVDALAADTVAGGTSAPSVSAPAATSQSGATPAATAAGKYATDAAALKRGRQVFVGSCGAYCHSTHNEERDAPSLFDCTWRHGGSDAEIFKSIAVGYPEARMPGWGGVLPQGDEDIWRVIAYLRSASTCTVAGSPGP